MKDMKKLLIPFVLLSASFSAGASGYAPAEVSPSDQPVAVTHSDITVANTFSFGEWIKEHWGADCHADLNATALSFADPLLSVQVEGKLCGEYVNTVEVVPVDGSKRPSVSDLFGETAVIAALKRDPYLNRTGQLQGANVDELAVSLGENGFFADCPISGAALDISLQKYAFWQAEGEKIGVRLALPMQCGGTTKDNDFEWLGLMLPSEKLQLPVQLYAAEQPKTVAHLQW